MDLLKLVIAKLFMLGLVLGLRLLLLQVVEAIRLTFARPVPAPVAPPVIPKPTATAHDTPAKDATITYHPVPIATERPGWQEVHDLPHQAQFRRHRLRFPDFEGLEEELGIRLPQCVQEFYADPRKALDEDLLVHAPRWRGKTEAWSVRHFVPADIPAMNSWSDADRNLRTFRFAADPWGNHYVIRLDREDPPVWLQQRGTGRMTFVCPRFSDFAGARREPRGVALPSEREHGGVPPPLAWLR